MIYKTLREKLKSSKTLEALYLAKKNWDIENISIIQKQIIEIKEVQEKKALGIQLNQLKTQSNLIFEEYKASFLNEKHYSHIDLSISNHNLSYSSLNILTEIKEDLIFFFNSWNFQIQIGNEIVSEEENFDNLLIPRDHPSRSKEETYYFSKKLLRTHCTGSGIELLNCNTNKEEEFRLATIGAVYRKDDEDPRHTLQFNQLDLLWVQKDLNVANLKWFILLIFKHIFGEDKEFRFRNSYFPFTEPSYELDMKCVCSNSSSCSICGNSRWIEVLGCGLLHSQILKNAGYSEEYQALAAGIGLERIALIKYQLSDIRNIYKNNLVFLTHAN